MAQQHLHNAQLEIPHAVQGDPIQIARTRFDTAEEVGLRRVLTYGTYDLLHYGHVRLLQRAAALGDYLIVALSTDEFNAEKGKESFYPYHVRREMLEAMRYVDLVIPEISWDQKRDDVERYCVDVVCMGGDWVGNPYFEQLRDVCDVVYFERTEGISTTSVRSALKSEDQRLASQGMKQEK